MDKKPRIALLLGGTSPERKVSKATGAAVYNALINLGYDPIIADPAYGETQPENMDDFFAEKDFRPLSNRNYVECLESKIFDEIDLVFLALHGKWGEDGTVQSLLELRGIKYTGSKILSSSISMDKAMSKILFQHYGVPTPDWILFNNKNTNPEAASDLIAKKLRFPAVIKPNDQGSTVGLSICKDKNEIDEALKLAFQYSENALAEKYIPGRELTVAVIESKSFPVLEIKPKHDLYDYECKYTAGMSEYIVPADIPKEISENLKLQALKAFTALNCEGYARVDFRLTPEGESYCLEVNTLPGMTATSLVPKMAKASGISFEDLIERIIKLSL
jgi:D-alanine-D-alanine ligase